MHQCVHKCPARWARHRESPSRRPHLVQQLRVAVQHLQQLPQGQRRAGLAGLVARDGIDAAAEDGSGLALVERQLLADVNDEGRVHGRGVDLLDEVRHLIAEVTRLCHVQDGLGTGWAFHGHSSLKDTISTSSMTVSFRQTSPTGVLGRYTSCQIRWSAWVVIDLHQSCKIGNDATQFTTP